MKHILFTLVLALSPSVMSAQCPDNNHPHMIDLGLPSGLKWACRDVGTNIPFIGWYAWGETEEKEEYRKENYKWLSDYSYTKYTLDDKKEVLELKDDVAHVKWGNGWRMPTLDEMKELIGNTTASFDTSNKGFFLKSKINGAWIFLPARGEFRKEDRNGITEGSYYNSFYWTSTIHFGSKAAYFIRLDGAVNSNRAQIMLGETAEFREYGLCVRAVHK